MKQVIAVRTDLGMSKGKLAGQVAHAAVKVSHQIENKNILDEWQEKGAPKIVVKVDSEEQIQSLAKKSENNNIPYTIISDLGHTELEPDTTTTIGFGPADNEDLDKITGDLSLL